MTDVSNFLYWYRARCLRVVDGDTIDVLTDLGFRIGWEQRIRLYRADTYELNDSDSAKRALAMEGKAFVAARIEGEGRDPEHIQGPRGQVRPLAGGGVLLRR